MRGAASAVTAGVAAALLVPLSLQHPLAPAAVLALGLAWAAAVAWRPSIWLVAVPACLAWLDFAPWTGWLAHSELDVLLLATLAGGHARRVRDGVPTPWPAPRTSLAFAALLGLGLARAWADAPVLRWSGFDDAFAAANALRVTKPLAALLLVAPLLADAQQRLGGRAAPRVLLGVVLGLAVAVAGAIAERAAYPGLLDMSTPWRSTALFWEMHVGGAAIDAYLAVTLPLVAWALTSARGGAAWLLAALLAVAATYAALTTFSRGVYLACGVSMLLLAVRALSRGRGPGQRWRRRLVQALAVLLATGILVVADVELAHPGLAVVLVVAGVAALLWVRAGEASARWRTAAAGVLTLTLLAEAVAVFGPGSYMGTRVAQSADDLGSRGAHWRAGIGLLHGPADWLLGLGAGRLPSHYASEVRGGAPAGRLTWQADGRGGHVRVEGPPRGARRRGDLALTQRVPPQSTYAASLDAATSRGALLYLRVCEAVLLYDLACQATARRIPPMPPGHVRRLQWPLEGPPLARPALFMVSVVNAGGELVLDNVVLTGDGGRALLANGGFDDGLARWLPVARQHFLPWHIDSLPLEWLIERGLAGLAAFVAIVGVALHRLLLGRARTAEEAPCVAASLAGVLTVGLVSSVMDVPRVAFLAGLLLLVALQLRPAGAAGRTPTGTAAPSPAG